MHLLHHIDMVLIVDFIDAPIAYRGFDQHRHIVAHIYEAHIVDSTDDS